MDPLGRVLETLASAFFPSRAIVPVGEGVAMTFSSPLFVRTRVRHDRETSRLNLPTMFLSFLSFLPSFFYSLLV